MKTSSAKAKGRRLQDSVKNLLMETYKTELRDGDIKTAIMGESGKDVILSPHAQDVVGKFAIECKNQEKLNVWKSLEQAIKNSEKDEIPLLVFKRNHSKTFVSLTIEDFIKLLNHGT